MMKNSVRSFLNVFRNNWHLKLFSFIIAVVVWFIVVQYVNPEDTRKIEDIYIEINTVDSIPVAEGLVLVTDYNEKVTITYKAGRDTIAMLDIKKIKAYVDVSSATKSGEYTYPVRIDTGGQNIEIVDQSVKEAVLKFEKSITKPVTIEVVSTGIVPEGYLKKDPILSSKTIDIEGPESKINQITAIEAIVPEKSFTETKTYDCEYRFLDESRNTVTKEYINSPERISVNVPVLKTKEIPVTGTIINSSGGYENNFASIYFSPSTILIAGSDEALETYNSYSVASIDVSEKSADFTQSYKVSLAQGIENVNNVEQIDASVVFGDVVTKKIEFRSFKVLNAPKDKTVEIMNKSCVVTFRGMVDDIAKINADNVEIQIDLKDENYTNGRHEVPIHAVIPSDYKVGVVGKYYLNVKVN